MTVSINTFDMSMIDKVSMPHVMSFIHNQLLEFDTRLIEWIKLLPLNKKAILHGCCSYPQRVKPRSRSYKTGYRLRASVNTELAPPYNYLHWGRIPSAKCKQGWYSGEKIFSFDDLEECAVHTLAHECFHFLSPEDIL